MNQKSVDLTIKGGSLLLQDLFSLLLFLFVRLNLSLDSADKLKYKHGKSPATKEESCICAD